MLVIVIEFVRSARTGFGSTKKRKTKRKRKKRKRKRKSGMR